MLRNASKQNQLNFLSHATVHPNHTTDTSTGVKTVEENGLLKEASSFNPSSTKECLGLQVFQDRSLSQENGQSGTVHPVDQHKELSMAGMIIQMYAYSPVGIELDCKWHTV